ncbi:tail fiber protein [Lysobacter sp. BMK333-48F3]|uniref:phage tail protein n=1 Tax=Lysobacter sp. BMK333-48F3 TaxID=2867962 RepID=UPI001C8B1F19|nr:tail fiber protein [Lysobacter sp. BMK333-48F3]MBX9402809.1 tail fiber protein [Lysobacter sp. BMK333-48F3]
MSEPYVGEIRMFGFGRVPTGWFACDGSLYPISEYEVLFVLLGTTYGGDGQTTFAVPDLRGRAPVHFGNGQGLSPYVIGQRGGNENVTLISNQMPQHTHTMVATTLLSTANQPGSTVELGALSGDTMYLTDIASLPPIPQAAAAVTPAGGSQPHDNLMPTLTVQFCIAWAGIFPSQN